MLEHTFIHIPGIGLKTERDLWGKGISTWERFLLHPDPVLGRGRDSAVRRELETSCRERGNLSYFRDRLPPGEQWRLFEAFQDRTAYLDIETTGGFYGGDDITVIGIFDGSTVHTFINGQNLEDFEEALEGVELLVTFNGSGFDLPFIRRRFSAARLPKAHLDLRYLLGRLRYRGGLKVIEKQLGLTREPDLEGLDGYDAVRLWRAYEWGDETALDRLIRYNAADIVNLKPLMAFCARRLKADLLAGC